MATDKLRRWMTGMHYLFIRVKDADEDLNRRARVEQMLFDVASGNAPLPSKEDCRQIALYLGIRGYKKPIIAGVPAVDSQTNPPADVGGEC